MTQYFNNVSSEYFSDDFPANSKKYSCEIQFLSPSPSKKVLEENQLRNHRLKKNTFGSIAIRVS